MTHVRYQVEARPGGPVTYRGAAELAEWDAGTGASAYAGSVRCDHAHATGSEARECGRVLGKAEAAARNEARNRAAPPRP